MKIGVSGTFDVDNFGDLLFPLIAEKQLSDFDCIAISPTSTKTIFSDAIVPLEISSSLDGLNALIIGGGNIIRTSNSTLQTYLDNNVGHNAYTNLWLSSCLANNQNSAPIIWNAPGVAEEVMSEQKEYVRNCLMRTDYISVRDKQSKNILLSVHENAEIHVVPDSAWQLPKLFLKEELFSDFYNVVSGFTDQNYGVFHFNSRYIGSNSSEKLSAYVEKICGFYNIKPILVAIGGCHGDGELIDSISASLSIPNIKLTELSSLKEVISLLAYAKVYFGSSMHGLITSAAFGNAAVCIADGKIKFDGIQDLFSETQVIYNSWEQLLSHLDRISLEELSSASRQVSSAADIKLDIHWNTIRELVSNSEAKIDFSKMDKINKQLNSISINVLNAKVNMLSKRERKLSRDIEKQCELYDKLSKEYKDLQRNSNELREKYKSLNALINRTHVRMTFRVFDFLSRVPYAKQSLNSLRKIKHKLSEEVQAKRVSVSNLRGTNSEAVTWRVRDDSLAELRNYKNAKTKAKKYAVVSALYGASDQLILPLTIRNDFDYFCFTDKELNTFGLWKLCQSPYYHSDPTRMARYVKMHLHSMFSKYDAVIWCDANIRFEHSMYERFYQFVEDEVEAKFIKHPHRNCVYEEAEACVKLGKDDKTTINSQVERYRQLGIKEQAGMYETGLYFIKPKSENVEKFYKFWWKEIIIGSRRDQMSITPAIEASNLSVSLLLEPGVCVRMHPGCEIIPHKALAKMATPDKLKEFESIEVPTKQWDTSTNDLHTTTDVIICVYNALDDVKMCIDSVVQHSYESINKIIIINDFSDEDTSNYLAEVNSQYDKVHLVNNEVNLGYTKSANVGLRTSQADFRIILNSDTIVTPNWVSKLTEVAFSSESVGIVGPISNAAGSQSVPSIKGTKGQTAVNSLPDGYTIEDMNRLAEENSNKVYPSVPLIHGFCIGIKASVIEKIGFFDDINFARYYGEENDYCLRAYREGFELLIASNTYIFHSKSKSIEEEERILHMSEAGKKLREIYGKQEMRDYCLQLERNPNLVVLRKFYDQSCYK